jgi:hypothetical protein
VDKEISFSNSSKHDRFSRGGLPNDRLITPAPIVLLPPKHGTAPDTAAKTSDRSSKRLSDRSPQKATRWKAIVAETQSLIALHKQEVKRRIYFA